MFKSMKRIIRWAGKYRGRLYLGSVFSFFSSLSTAIPTMAAAYALDKSIQAYWAHTTIDASLIWKMLWIIVGSIALNFLFSYLRAILQESIGYEVAAGQRIHLGDVLKRVPLGYFSQNSVGDILAGVTTELSTLELQGMKMVDVIINGYAKFIAIVLCLIFFSPVAAVISIVGVALSALALQGISRHSEKTAATTHKAMEDMSGAAIEYIRGLSSVKSFGQEGASIENFRNASKELKDIHIKVEKGYALGELFYQHTRPAATSSTVTMRFNISEAQTSAVLIPKGTRVSNGQNMFWATVEDRYIAAGQTHGDVTAECMTAGTAGNGYLAGQIATIVDVFDYYTSCTNLTESGGGSDAPTDDEFYEQLRQSEDNYSTAGPKGGYIAKAKAVSNDIADVLPNSPTPGEVRIYVLMEDGTIAGQEVKNAVLAACNADETRPLTDHVLVEDPETVEYDIDVTYYLNRGGPSAADVQSEVNAAVDAYVKWQAGKLGRDINPSELTRRMMVNGVKRIVIRSPVYAELRSGNVATDASGRVALADLTNTVPQVGKLRGRTVTSGGYEDE